MRLRPLLALVVAVAVVALLGYGLVAKNHKSIAIGESAPSTPLPLLDGSGTAQISDYRGQWVFLNFWASWCPPCEDESPEIQKWAEQHRADVRVVGIDTHDNSEDGLGFVDEHGLTWTMLRDGAGTTQDDYGVYQLPESFLIDPDGKLALIQHGLVDRAFLDKHVTPLIEGKDQA